MSASATINTIARQFHRQAPQAIKVNGRTFKQGRVPSVYDNAKSEITFTYTARKKKGEFIATAIKVAVSYNHGLDLYDVKVLLVDGATFEQSLLRASQGVYASNLGTVLEVAARQA